MDVGEMTRTYDVDERSNKEGGDLLYICISHWVKYKWYVFNPSTGDWCEAAEMNSEKLGLYCGCASLGSKIYIIGGQSWNGGRYWDLGSHLGEATKSFKVFDTVCKKWEVYEDTQAARSCPLVVPTANKLYVFGGLGCWKRGGEEKPVLEWRRYNQQAWGELYDMGTGKWCSIREPPTEVVEQEYLYGYAIYRSGHKLILWNNYISCMYDADEDCWVAVYSVNHEIDDRCPQDSGLSIRATMIYDYFFWYYGADLFHYDLTLSEPCRDTICTLEREYRPPMRFFSRISRSPFLVAINGGSELCLIWYDDIKKACCWVTFLVGRPSTDEAVIAYRHKSGKFNNLHRGVAEMRHCLVVPKQPKEDVKHDLPEWYNEKIQSQDPETLLIDLVRTMYGKSYLSYYWNLHSSEDIIDMWGSVYLQGSCMLITPLFWPKKEEPVPSTFHTVMQSLGLMDPMSEEGQVYITEASQNEDEKPSVRGKEKISVWIGVVIGAAASVSAAYGIYRKSKSG